MLKELTDAELMIYLCEAVEMQDSKLIKKIKIEINRRNKNE